MDSILFRRLFIRFLVGTGIACFVFMALVHLFTRQVVDKEWREDMHQEAVWLARHTPLEHTGVLAIAWRTMHSSVRVTFFDTEGIQVADSHPERVEIDLAAFLKGESPPGQLTTSAPLVNGKGTLVMSRPFVPAFPGAMRWELVLALLLIVGPMVLLLYPLVRSMNLTLRDMGQLAQHVSAGHFGGTLPVTRSDELGTLVQSFNDMSQKLAEAERLNSRLLHDVSHELRSPLGRIQALADTIERRPEQREQCLRGIGQEVTLLDRLVGDLLQVARLESEEPSIRLETFSVAHWAAEILTRLELDAVSKGIEWTSHLPEGDRDVRGDPQHLVQALANVVDNAIHALGSQDGARIYVRVSFDESTWTLAVTDNGPGIPEHHLKHLFRRFYRADEHRDRDGGGSGLGLSLVLAVAEAHGGTATVESQLGKGTTVTLRFSVDCLPNA